MTIFKRKYKRKHQPIVKQVDIDIHRIWYGKPKTVSQDLEPLVKIAMRGNNDKRK